MAEWAGDETARLAILDEFGIGPGQSKALDEAARFAAALCEAPSAMVSIVEQARQRFIARTGVSEAETPRAFSFCAHAMLEDEIMVVPDARLDQRFAENPMVLGPPFIRFYAGAPLVTREGVPLGSLCVIDSVPRQGLTPLQAQGLRIIASGVMAGLDARRRAKARTTDDARTEAALSDSERRFRTLADTMPQMVWSTLPDGFHDYYNARWYEFTGVPEGSTDGEEWNGMFHPDDQERAWGIWRQSLATGEPYDIEYRLRRHDGEYRWTLGRALPIRDETGQITRWFGTCTDIHEQKLLAEQRELIAHELSHRIKNIFSVIAGLIGFSARAKPELAPVAEELRERVIALGRAHDFVRPHSANSAALTGQNSLIGVLGELFGAYRSGESSRVTIAGDDIRIDDRSATPLALLFHELATNAVKYGALSTLDGHVAMSLSQTDTSCVVEWREIGGPPVVAPSGEGFGSRLMELSIVRQLGGGIARDWLPDGLVVRLEVPKAAMSRGRD